MKARFGEKGWIPRWKRIATWRAINGGVSGGVNAKRRQGKGLSARRAAAAKD